MEPRVLIVDDDKRVVAQVKAFLLKNGFKQVETVFSLGEALEKSKAKHFDAIVSDMIMETEEAGFELVEKYREFSPLVLIITAYFNTEMMRKCMRAGAYDYISKNEGNAYQQIAASIREGIKELKEKHRPVDRDALFISNNFDALEEKYAGEYVAILDEVEVEHDKDYEKIKKSMDEKYPYVNVSIVSIPEKEESIG